MELNFLLDNTYFVMNKLILSKTEDVFKLSYVDFMALLEERNRPPGGKDSIRRIAINSFLTKHSNVLHIGCNTGISTRLIASYSKCKAIGIDIAPSMITTAKKITKTENMEENVSFEVQNSRELKFKNASFDLIFSAGSVAFMNNKKEVVDEAVRVLKEYGFLADVVMFYQKTPPDDLIKQMNSLMNINIQKWDISFWKKLYSHQNLSIHYTYSGKFKVPSKNQIKSYCNEMTRNLPYNKAIKSAIYQRLFDIMELFAENHKYLAYAILMYQKTPIEDQVDLFGK